VDLGERAFRVEAIYADRERRQFVGWAVWATEPDGQWGFVKAQSYPHEERHDRIVQELRDCVLELLEYF
jgi:hypothetical protein